MIRGFRVAALAAGLLACLPLHYLWKAFRLRSIWPQIFLAYAGRCVGLRVDVRGRVLGEPVLFVANHVTWLDILILGGAAGPVFVSRDDLESWPLIGWIAGLNETLYVARNARRQVHGQADQLRQALARRRSVALFPEGTTATSMRSFRPSLFASLYPALPGVKVQPVAIDYGPLTPRLAWVDDEPAGTHVARILSRRGRIPVRLEFLEPIDPASAGDRKRLAALAEARVANALAASGAAGDPLYGQR